MPDSNSVYRNGMWATWPEISGIIPFLSLFCQSVTKFNDFWAKFSWWQKFYKPSGQKFPCLFTLNVEADLSDVNLISLWISHFHLHLSLWLSHEEPKRLESLHHHHHHHPDHLADAGVFQFHPDSDGSAKIWKFKFDLVKRIWRIHKRKFNPNVKRAFYTFLTSTKNRSKFKFLSKNLNSNFFELVVWKVVEVDAPNQKRLNFQVQRVHPDFHWPNIFATVFCKFHWQFFFVMATSK